MDLDGCRMWERVRGFKFLPANEELLSFLIALGPGRTIKSQLLAAVNHFTEARQCGNYALPGDCKAACYHSKPHRSLQIGAVCEAQREPGIKRIARTRGINCGHWYSCHMLFNFRSRHKGAVFPQSNN